MPLVYFNKKVLIRFWFVQFALFCLVFFSPASLSHTLYSVFLVQAFLNFSANLLCMTSTVHQHWGWCETTFLALKQLSASSVGMQLYHTGLMLRSLGFFSKEAQLLDYAHHANPSCSLSSDSFVWVAKCFLTFRSNSFGWQSVFPTSAFWDLAPVDGLSYLLATGGKQRLLCFMAVYWY